MKHIGPGPSIRFREGGPVHLSELWEGREEWNGEPSRSYRAACGVGELGYLEGIPQFSELSQLLEDATPTCAKCSRPFMNELERHGELEYMEAVRREWRGELSTIVERRPGPVGPRLYKEHNPTGAGLT